MIMYRKNKIWKPIYISIETDKLDTLIDEVGKKVRENLTISEQKEKWVNIDIVDTEIVTSGFNQKTLKTTILELIVYVADMTGK